MVQSFNGPALRAALRVLSRPRLLLPTASVESIANISFKGLRECGIQGVIFDKDNTLTAPYELSIFPSLKEAFEEAKAEFAGKCVIMSNSAGTPDDPQFKAAIQIEEALGVPVLRHKDKKPEGIESISDFFGGGSIPLHTLCMVGDRLFTDVLLGNLHGMLTIRTAELTRVNDNRPAAMIRSLESRFLRSQADRNNNNNQHPLFDQKRMLK